MPVLLLLLSVLLVHPGAAPEGLSAGHNVHVSHARLAVEGQVVVGTIHYYRHDLEVALQQFHHDASLRLSADARGDSLYARYAEERFRLEQDGQALKGRVVASGEEGEQWWYIVQYEAPETIRSLRLTNAMLLDVFPDQRNLCKVRHFPSETSQSLFFARGAEAYTLSF